MKPYSSIKILSGYLKHQLIAKNRHGIHSPFVYRFYEEVIVASRKNNASFGQAEDLLSLLKKSNESMQYIDPSSAIHQTKTIGQIAMRSAKRPRLGRLLGKAMAFLKPQNALELGTSLGVSAAYQNALFKPLRFHTIEGNSALINHAKANLAYLEGTVEVIEGYFDVVLPSLLELNDYDWVFIDGNHQYEPTMSYFNQLKKKASDNCVLIFDDINWSADMQRAWQEIISDPLVTANIDLYFLGFVFFSRNLSKETFKLRL